MKRLTIETEMNKFFTHPKLRIIILAQPKSFYNNTPIEKINPEQNERCDITSSIESQNLIGWQYFIRGRLTLSYLSIVTILYNK